MDCSADMLTCTYQSKHHAMFILLSYSVRYDGQKVWRQNNVGLFLACSAQDDSACKWF